MLRSLSILFVRFGNISLETLRFLRVSLSILFVRFEALETLGFSSTAGTFNSLCEIQMLYLTLVAKYT